MIACSSIPAKTVATLGSHEMLTDLGRKTDNLEKGHCHTVKNRYSIEIPQHVVI